MLVFEGVPFNELRIVEFSIWTIGEKMKRFRKKEILIYICVRFCSIRSNAFVSPMIDCAQGRTTR